MNKDIFFDHIKSVIKSKGFTQEEFAQMVGVSTPTIKRWLRGEGLLFADLNKILELLDVRFSEVSLMVEGTERNQFIYTKGQEEVLANTQGLLAFFDLLLSGKTVNQIARQFKLTNKSVMYYLAKLDKIGLIEWLPKNKIKLLVSGEPRWIENGPLATKFRKQMIEEHLSHYWNNRDQLKLGIYSLTSDSYHKIRVKFKEIEDDLRLMEIRDTKSSRNKKLTTLILGYSQKDIPILSQIPNR